MANDGAISGVTGAPRWLIVVSVSLVVALAGALGIVRATNGTYCLVEMDGETLAYYPHELEWTGKRVEG